MIRKIFYLLLSFSFLTSCNNDVEDIHTNEKQMRLSEFSFLAKNNNRVLISDIKCNILGDSVIECHIPHIMEHKTLIPNFNTNTGEIIVDGKKILSGITPIDCSRPTNLILTNGENTIKYVLRVKSFTGLPILYINTENGVAITSKDDYVKGSIKIVEDIETRGAGDIFESTMKIKGRGNSTWTFPKKPYKIKFDEKVSLLGEPADKEWVLLANYTDKTSLRNETAFDLGRMSNLEYTNRTHFVDVVLNGVYNGTYQLGEQLKISKNRVNVGDDGFLLEIDSKAEAEDITFKVAHIGYPINIKDPEVKINSEAYNYVVRYLATVDSVLFCDNFKDKENGYAKYIDVNSFVDWYLINEIGKNCDANFFTSCYMNLSREGKLKMGPLWDFDIAFGNINYNAECANTAGYWIRNVSWFRRLFQDPNFEQKVRERFDYFYSKRNDLFNEINANAQYLKYSIIENNYKWNTLYEHTWPNNTIMGSYENEVQELKTWLDKRFEWLNQDL
ncbi:MAG: CotH kinase family protein [Bacteroidaceae bacterium]|nr:CotH kinase family protein [Bacteroidaceae bacterium]